MAEPIYCLPKIANSRWAKQFEILFPSWFHVFLKGNVRFFPFSISWYLYVATFQVDIPLECNGTYCFNNIFLRSLKLICTGIFMIYKWNDKFYDESFRIRCYCEMKYVRDLWNDSFNSNLPPTSAVYTTEFCYSKHV